MATECVQEVWMEDLNRERSDLMRAIASEDREACMLLDMSSSINPSRTCSHLSQGKRVVLSLFVIVEADEGVWS
jgi:hypothetical protein